MNGAREDLLADARLAEQEDLALRRRQPAQPRHTIAIAADSVDRRERVGRVSSMAAISAGVTMRKTTTCAPMKITAPDPSVVGEVTARTVDGGAVGAARSWIS